MNNRVVDPKNINLKILRCRLRRGIECVANSCSVVFVNNLGNRSQRQSSCVADSWKIERIENLAKIQNVLDSFTQCKIARTSDSAVDKVNRVSKPSFQKIGPPASINIKQ